MTRTGRTKYLFRIIAPRAVDGDRVEIYTETAAYPNNKQGRSDMRCFSRWFWSVVAVLAFCAAPSVWSADNFTRQDITFKSAGLNLVGWLYVPNGLKSGEKRPAIVMAHGWSAVKEMYL